MTLNSYERRPMKKLLAELERKLQLAKTSIHASGQKGQRTISERAIQVDVVKALLATA